MERPQPALAHVSDLMTSGNSFDYNRAGS